MRIAHAGVGEEHALFRQHPFGEPRVLKELTGFVEAPSISLDRKEMFFHKKVDERFAIFRAERNTL